MAKTILVVDDEPSIVQTLSGILQDEGFEVITAPDGETALRWWKRRCRIWCCWI